MSKRALRELRQTVRAHPEAATFLLSVLSSASEVVVRKPLVEMLHVPSQLSASAFDAAWMTGELDKYELAAALVVLLEADSTPSRVGWKTLAGAGAIDSPGHLLPKPDFVDQVDWALTVHRTVHAYR